ncbi:uncharacterized protein METZ01_LOCUS428144, partial [marine metagenome]
VGIFTDALYSRAKNPQHFNNVLPDPLKAASLDISFGLTDFTFQKSGLKPPTSVGKDFNCAP